MSGALSVAIFSSKHANISVLYCDQHCDATKVGFDWRKKPVLTWSSLHIMRGYLAVKRGKALTLAHKRKVSL